MFSINAANNFIQKQKVSFGTNLILGKGVAERLATNPYEQKKIDEFKETLAKDGKDWNAELTYDTFEPKKVSLDETEKLIRKYVASYDSNAREQAEKNISQIKDSQVVAAFIEKLSKDSDNKVAVAAVEKVGEIKDPKIAVELVEKLIQGQNSDVKEAAVLGIWGVQGKDEELFNKTIEKFLNSEDANVRRSATKILYKMKDSEHFDAFIEKLHNDSDPVIREYVACAIADIDDDRYNNNAKLYDEIIQKGLKDSEPIVKRATFNSIGRLADSKKAATLIESVLSSDENSWEKARAAESIGYIKDTQLAKSLILKHLENPNSEIREGVARTLFHIKDESLQKELIDKVLDSKETKIRRAVAWGISDIKDSNHAIAIAERLLNDPDADVRETMSWQLGWINDDNVRNSLISKHISDKDFDVRKGIADAVERLADDNPEKAAEFAQMLAKDEDKYIQKSANKILEKIKEQEAENHYHLKISDGNKVVGETNISNNRNISSALFKPYQSIFDKNA